MGRLSQLYWYLNFDELPSKHDRAFIFTHLDVEREEMKKLRREYRSRIRKEEKESQVSFLEGLKG